jgi:hypothetical protein
MANRRTIFNNNIFRLKRNHPRLLHNLFNLSEAFELIPLSTPTLSPSAQLPKGTHKGRIKQVLVAEFSRKLSKPHGEFYQKTNC